MVGYNYGSRAGMAGNGFTNNPLQQIFVQGFEGAKAFQMPYGVQAIILWDTEDDLFYVKQIDAMGRPFIAKTCRYMDYVKPEPSIKADVDTSNFVTREYLEEVLKKLSVGEKGRIVIDESNE